MDKKANFEENPQASLRKGKKTINGSVLHLMYARMPMKNKKISVDLANGVVGKWNESYQWIPIFGAFAATAMAFLAGANNLPAPFSTPLGSGALTVLKASIVAFLIYIPGAAFASNNSTVTALFSNFLKETQPDEGFLMWSMVVVLLTATLWLVLATYLELPVSSQQSMQSALLGTMVVTEGFSYIPMWNKNENHNFNGGGLLWIILEWIVAPLIACICSYCFFTVLKASILRHDNAEKRVLIFLPIDYGISAGLLCLFAIYQIKAKIDILIIHRWAAFVVVAVAFLIGSLLSLVVVVPLVIRKFKAIQNYKMSKQNPSANGQSTESENRTGDKKEEDDVEDALRDFMQMRVLETVYEEEERSWASPEAVQLDTEQTQSVPRSSSEQSTPFKKLLQSTPNRLIQTKNLQTIDKTTHIDKAIKFIRDFTESTFYPVIKYDRQTLIRHALAEKYDEIEDFFSFPQLLASCIFALIQSATEIATIVSPYGVIVDVFYNREKYDGNGNDVGSLHVTWWFRAIAGLIAAMGFFLGGWRLTQSLGGKLIYISNSRGLASQLSTVAAMIMVTRLQLPVSSIHALVGSLVGVGIADDLKNVNWKQLIKFLCGSIMNVIFCGGVAYVMFSASVHSPAYVVP